MPQVAFVYFTPPSVMRVSGDVATLAQELVDYIATLKQPLPEYWVVGVSPKDRALEIRPMPKTVFGALYLYRKTGELPQFRSIALVDWLSSLGVPEVVEVRYQESTGTIVGQWEEPAAIATPVTQAPAEIQEAIPCAAEVAGDPESQPIPYVPTEKAEASLPAGMIPAEPKRRAKVGSDGVISRAGGHRWVESGYVSPNGVKQYICSVCGMYTGNLTYGLLKKRPCFSGLYKECYTIRGTVVETIKGAVKPDAIAIRLARLKEEASKAEVASGA